MRTQNKKIIRFYILPIIATIIAIWFWRNYCCETQWWWIIVLVIILAAHYIIFSKRNKENTQDDL